ncbi:MAG: GNAT family N-acetyltransferase [Alphaproteobacteria bacterium PRO2]|nr:GNAT family N-acetyltransferase [Alphaproteobacteria bacterium PRO2]
MADTQIQKDMPDIQIRQAGYKDLDSLREMSLAMRQAKEPDYFEQQIEFQEAGERLILIAAEEGEDAGYCLLNWEPKYGYFKAHEIPEIQDLNVLPEFRRQGIATKMILYCEELAARKGCKRMGISFGLHPGFGAAQRLYIKLGYVPDGYGATYDRKIVAEGEFKPIDDQLCLMLVKNL